MPYVVKSSLDIGGKIVPWNEQEANKLIKEKEEFVKQKIEEPKEEINEEVIEEKQDAKKEENASKNKQDAYMPLRRNKKRDKVGER